MKRVLVVDDVLINVKLLTALLSANGFEVQSAASAEAALGVLPAGRFDLMLLDVRLPGMDGLTLARTLRADDAYRTLAIIAVTANAMKTDEEAALAAGCDGFVSKPINTRTLVPLIQDLLARR